jgi:hypothetical protein
MDISARVSDIARRSVSGLVCVTWCAARDPAKLRVQGGASQGVPRAV